VTTPTPPPADPAARLLRVYSDAEHELLSTLAREVDKQLADPTDHRAEYINRVKATAARVVAGLEHGNRARVAAIVAKADAAGRTVAARQLAVATGRRRPAHEEPLNLGAVDQLAAAVADQLTDAHRSILRTVPDVYRSVIARAAVGTALGTQTRRQTAQRAMWEFTRRGVTGFTDRAGRNWELSSYAEMATRTASARAAVDAQLAALAADGHDLVIVSDHAQECSLCRPWEGRVLSISGAGGHPSVATARAAGLLHPNCRHALGLYLEGITKAPTGPGTGPDPVGDKARQRQRAIERQIREWKRRQTAALDPSTRRYAAAKVKAWQAEMRTHLDQHPTLKRLSYRESPGAGNHPTSATYRDNPAGPFPNRDLRPNELSDDQLDTALTDAIAAEDFDRLDLLEVEADRRDAQKHADAARRAGARHRAALRKERDEDAKVAEYERLLDDGVDDETAIARVYGISVEQQRRRRAIAQLREDGLRGKGFDDLSRESFRHRINADYADAEDATNGYMLNKAGARAGIDPRSLFTGPETRARKYASDELRAWWDIHGRPTLEEHRAELLGETGAAGRLRSARGDFLA
jgi:hypothetical protein